MQYRTMTESCKTSDRVTAQALAEKKFGELNGLAPAGAKPIDTTIEELAALDEQWLANRGRAERTVYLSRLALRMFQDVVETPDRKPLEALDDHGAGCGELPRRPAQEDRGAVAESRDSHSAGEFQPCPEDSPGDENEPIQRDRDGQDG